MMHIQQPMQRLSSTLTSPVVSSRHIAATGHASTHSACSQILQFAENERGPSISTSILEFTFGFSEKA
jgi:hypothetical protein